MAVALSHAAVPAAAQTVQTSVSNEFRYGIGRQFEGDNSFRKEYLEDLLNTRVYAGDLTLGFRIQVDKPREYGRDTIGLTEYYAEFRRENLRARAGTFYHMIDRGLIFNTFESRPLGFETRSEGVRLDYDGSELGLNAFGGMLHYPEITSATRLEEYLVRGLSGEVRPATGVEFGGGYVQATARSSRNSYSKPFDAYLRSLYFHAVQGPVTAHLSIADKRTQLDSVARANISSRMYGTGLYGMLGYTAEGIGITAEYKNYRFDLVEPDEIQAGTRATRALPFQYPPTLIPEHDKTLLARNPHPQDPNDEVGFQFETFINPVEDLSLTLLANGGSRHEAWRADSAEGGGVRYTRLSASPANFPRFDVQYSPYWEIFLGGERVIDEGLSLGFGVQHRDNLVYLEGNGSGSKSETYKANTVMLEMIADLDEFYNLHAIVEGQQVYDSKKATAANDSLGISEYSGRYSNALLTLEVANTNGWAVNGRMEYSTTHREQGGRQFWPVFGVTYRLGREHTIGLQYGSERGGVVCTGGVCRFLNPFDGLRFYVISKL